MVGAVGVEAMVLWVVLIMLNNVRSYVGKHIIHLVSGFVNYFLLVGSFYNGEPANFIKLLHF